MPPLPDRSLLPPGRRGGMLLGWIKVPDKVHAKRCALRHGVMASFVLVFPSAGMGAKLIGAMTTFGMTMNRCGDSRLLTVDVTVP